MGGNKLNYYSGEIAKLGRCLCTKPVVGGSVPGRVRLFSSRKKEKGRVVPGVEPVTRTVTGMFQWKGSWNLPRSVPVEDSTWNFRPIDVTPRGRCDSVNMPGVVQ